MRDENDKRREALKAAGVEVDSVPNLLQEDNDDDVLFQSDLLFFNCYYTLLVEY